MLFGSNFDLGTLTLTCGTIWRLKFEDNSMSMKKYGKAGCAEQPKAPQLSHKTQVSSPILLPPGSGPGAATAPPWSSVSSSVCLMTD